MIQRSHSNNNSLQESEISLLKNIVYPLESKESHFEQQLDQQASLPNSKQKNELNNFSFVDCLMQDQINQTSNKNIDKSISSVEISINQSPQNKLSPRNNKSLEEKQNLINLIQIPQDSCDLNHPTMGKNLHITKCSVGRAESVQHTSCNDSQKQFNNLNKPKQNQKNIQKNNQSNDLKCIYKIFPQINVKLLSIKNSELKQQSQTQNHQNNLMSIKPQQMAAQLKQNPFHCISTSSTSKSQNRQYSESPIQKNSTEESTKQFVKRSFDDIIKKINNNPYINTNKINQLQTEPNCKQKDLNDISLNDIICTENMNTKSNDILKQNKQILIKCKPKSQMRSRCQSIHSSNENIYQTKTNDQSKFLQDKLMNYISYKFNQIDKNQDKSIYKDEIIHFFETNISYQNSYIEFELHIKKNFSKFVLELVEIQTEKAGVMNYYEFKQFLKDLFSKVLTSNDIIENQNNYTVTDQTIDINLYKRQLTQKVKKASNEQKIISLKRIYSENKSRNLENQENFHSNQQDNSFQLLQSEYRSQSQKKPIQFKQYKSIYNIQNSNKNLQKNKQMKVNQSLNLTISNEDQQNYCNQSLDIIDNQYQNSKQADQNDTISQKQNDQLNISSQNLFKVKNQNQQIQNHKICTSLKQSDISNEQQNNNSQNNLKYGIKLSQQDKSYNINRNNQSFEKQNNNHKNNEDFKTPIKNNCFLDQDQIQMRSQTVQDQNIKSSHSTNQQIDNNNQLSKKNDKLDKKVYSTKQKKVVQDQDKDKISSFDQKLRSQSVVSAHKQQYTQSDSKQQYALTKKNSTESNDQNDNSQSQQSLEIYKQPQRRYDNYYLKYSKESKNYKISQIKNNRVTNNEISKDIQVNQLIKVNKVENDILNNGDLDRNMKEQSNEVNIKNNSLASNIKQSASTQISSENFQTPERMNNPNFEQKFSKIKESLNSSDNQLLWNLESDSQQLNYLDFTKTSSFASNENNQKTDGVEDNIGMGQRKNSSPVILDEQGEHKLAFGNKINTRIWLERQQNQRVNQFGTSGSLLLRQYKMNHRINLPQKKSSLILNQNDPIIEQIEPQTEPNEHTTNNKNDNLQLNQNELNNKDINLECTFRPQQIENQLNSDSQNIEQQDNKMEQMDTISYQQTKRDKQENQQIVDNFSFNPNQNNIFEMNLSFIIPNSKNEQINQQNIQHQKAEVINSEQLQNIKEIESEENIFNRNKHLEFTIIDDKHQSKQQINNKEQNSLTQNKTQTLVQNNENKRQKDYMKQTSGQSNDKSTQKQNKTEEIQTENNNKNISNIQPVQNIKRNSISKQIDQNCQNILKKKEVKVQKKESTKIIMQENSQKKQNEEQNSILNMNFIQSQDILPNDENYILNQITFGNKQNVAIDLNQNNSNQ